LFRGRLGSSFDEQVRAFFGPVSGKLNTAPAAVTPGELLRRSNSIERKRFAPLRLHISMVAALATRLPWSAYETDRTRVHIQQANETFRQQRRADHQDHCQRNLRHN